MSEPEKIVPAPVRFSQDYQTLLGKGRLSTNFTSANTQDETATPQVDTSKRASKRETKRVSKMGAGAFAFKRFRPIKRYERANRLNELMKQVDYAIREGARRTQLQPPEKTNSLEWAAAAAYAIFNHYNEVYGCMMDFCTARSCPSMQASNHWEYKWADGITIKTPMTIPAVDYCDNLMTWVEEDQLDDQAIFPDAPLLRYSDRKLMASLKDQWRRLLRISFHLEYHHREDLEFTQQWQHHRNLLRAVYYLMKFYRLYSADSFKPVASLMAQWKKETD